MRFALTTQSDKLPSYLQSLHHIRPARPSMVSQELGSDAGPKTQHLEASRSIFSSRYMQNRHQAKADANFYFFKRQLPIKTIQSRHHRFGGAERDRTADPLLAKQVLSQLSYSPISSITGASPLRLRQTSASGQSFPTIIPSRNGGPGKT